MYDVPTQRTLVRPVILTGVVVRGKAPARVGLRLSLGGNECVTLAGVALELGEVSPEHTAPAATKPSAL